MSDTPEGDGAANARPDPRVGLTIDLSSPRTGTRPRKPTMPRKGPPPVVVQTLNLSTPRPPKAEAPSAPAPASPAGRANPKAGRPKGPATHARRDAPRDAPRHAHREAPRNERGGTSLADLLDEATLARLRGG